MIYSLNEISKIKKMINREGFTDSQALQNIAEMYNTGNLTATNLNITGSFNMLPSGAIIAWSKNIIPDGWVHCNGQNGTPDLRNKFILSTNALNDINGTGGASSVALNDKHIPAHTHRLYAHGTSPPDGKNPETASHPYRFVFSRYGGLGPTSYSGGTGQLDAIVDNRSQTSFENVPIMPPYYKLIYIMKT